MQGTVQETRPGYAGVFPFQASNRHLASPDLTTFECLVLVVISEATVSGIHFLLALGHPHYPLLHEQATYTSRGSPADRA